MSLIKCNKGTGLVEVMVAIMLTSIAIMSVMSLQPNAWRLAARTDYLGRAAGVLASELEAQEYSIMRLPSSTNPTLGTVSRTIFTSGQSTVQTGDIAYTVQTTIANAGTQVWRITSQVTWPGNATGISGSIVVTKQDVFGSGT
jgi:Tfp pilus assembly protein PilV